MEIKKMSNINKTNNINLIDTKEKDNYSLKELMLVEAIKKFQILL